MKNFIYALIFSFVIGTAAQAYTVNVNEELKNGIVRLHIIANSDDKTDQDIKLEVRNAILEKLSLDDNNFLEKAEDIANEVLKKTTYQAKAEYGKFYFPRKEYGQIVLPFGEYNGVKITLGEGRGHNWWCILYPPMCVSENKINISKEAKKHLQENLDSDTYDIITSNGDEITVKFKTVEVFNKIYKLICRKN